MDGCLVKSQGRYGQRGVMLVLVLCFFSLVPGIGAGTPLTYHEAFVAQGACEILASGQWWHPTIDRLPWLEKPPLPFWLVAMFGQWYGHISPGVARVPSALAATALVLGVVSLAGHRYGRDVGLLAGAIQATTAWWVFRGRLAEADILLACLLTWTLVAFDRLRAIGSSFREPKVAPGVAAQGCFWRWAFFTLLGLASLVKGIGFGAVLVLGVVLLVILWDRDRGTLGRILWPLGWLLAGVLTLAWPLLVLTRYGVPVLGLWALHITERLLPQGGHGQFAGEQWVGYLLSVLGQGLPWTPLALLGSGLALCQRGQRAVRKRLAYNGPISRLWVDYKLLWAWTIVPLVSVSATHARNAHYAIYGMVPWAIWSALSLAHLRTHLERRGWAPSCLERAVISGVSLLALGYGAGYGFVGQWFTHRSAEVAFYEHVGGQRWCNEDLILLYDDWDREPYQTPFGQIPHDLALRLYYLRQPACWHIGAAALTDHPRVCKRLTSPSQPSLSLLIVCRNRDLNGLRLLGSVDILAHGPTHRWDRSFIAVRLHRNMVTCGG